MPRGQIDQFMDAMSRLESGGNPRARNPTSGAYGEFQIMPSNWDPWSKETFGRVAPKTPENQRQVARHKLLQYYDQFNDWDAVSIAWFAGPGRAQRYKNGDTSVLNMSDGATTVRKYIDIIRRNMAQRGQGTPQQSSQPNVSLPTATRKSPYELANRSEGVFQQFARSGRPDLSRFGPKQETPNPRQQLETNLLDVFSQLANRQAGGERLSIEEIEAGTDLTPSDDMFSGRDFMETGRAVDDRIDMASSAVQRILSPESQEFQQESQGISETGTLTALGQVNRSRMQALTEAVSQPGDIGVPEDAELDTDTRPVAISENYERGQALVDIASQYMGVPYKWGGTNPSRGLDCSGLIQLAAKQMGIDLPRVSRDQAKAGVAVGSLKEARPGDLVAFASRGLPVGHIGIYVGNGKMLNAPRSGTNVRIDSIGNRKPAAIRRVVR